FDYATATIKDETTINVFILGYGYANRNLLYSMLIDNQLPTIRNNQFALKKVNYFVFDKDKKEDKTFNYNLSRFVNAKLDTQSHFEMPETPFNITPINCDITSLDFQNHLAQIISKTDTQNTFNFVITSLGNDLENIDNSIRVSQLLTELGSQNSKLFVRLKDEAYKNMIEFDSKLTAFGDYEILNFDTIVNENLNTLSVDRNFSNQLKREEVLEAYEEINNITSVSKQEKALNKLKLQLWNRLNLFDKEYSSYNSINIRTKLNLLGLDIVGSSPISNKEYYKLYDSNNEMIVKNRVKIYSYPYPNTLTPRNSLAFQAHLHSNAFFAVKGYLPYDKKDIFKSTNDCYINIDKINRKAITLTTYSELNKITSERLKHNANLLELDLIAPLYQIMDNIPLYKYTNYIIYSTTTKDFK
ncbi:MAG: hypothetical protein ACI4TX_02565, partial [Christensenellales bacterium]